MLTWGVIGVGYVRSQEIASFLLLMASHRISQLIIKISNDGPGNIVPNQKKTMGPFLVCNLKTDPS